MMEAALTQPLPQIPPFKAAAAVLTSFDLAALHPAQYVEDRDDALVDLLIDCEPADKFSTAQRWQLAEVARRQVLFQLGRHPDGLRQALAANPDRPDDPVQRAMDELILGEGEIGHLNQRSLEELLALARAVDWLQGAVFALPARDDLLRRIEMKRLLKPFQRLLERGFVGRADELAALHDYVRSKKTSSILCLHGPGGVGKSTLMARFVLEVVAPELLGRRASQPFSFVYLDADRTVVDPKDPASFAREAVRQLAAQDKDIRDLAEGVQRGLVNIASRAETVNLESAGFDGAPAVGQLLLPLVNALFTRSGRPVLFIVDTWEEVQAAGASSEEAILDLLFDLAANPSVRVICAGRAPPRMPGANGIPASRARVSRWGFDEYRQISIDSFDEPTARAYLEGVARLPAQAVEPVIKAVGTAPLSLALAARVIEREGIDATTDLALLVAKVKSEQVQGQLFTRLLGHIHDADLQKLAQPGLVVRRITPDVIRHVLAGPCEVDVPDDKRADTLFLKLVDETALVETDEDDEQIDVAGSRRWPLRYRADLRQMALQDLRRAMPEQVAAIHAAAIVYCGDETAPRGRAEGIYHRLASGDIPPDDLWTPEMARWLRPGSMPELPARGRAWLLQRLGQSLDEVTRAAADFEAWERDTAEQARIYLGNRASAEALRLIRQRPGRGPTSPLWLLEAQALVQGGMHIEAEAFLSKAAEMAIEQGEPGQCYSFLLLLADVQGRQHKFEMALKTLGRAGKVSAGVDAIEHLRCLLAELRMSRKLRRYDADSEAAALAILDRPATQRLLERRPALLREAVAELGNERPEIVIQALRILGIGQVYLPSSWAPFRLPAWLARLLARIVGWLGAKLLGEASVMLTIDLLRTMIAGVGPSGESSLTLTQLGIHLADRLRRNANPAIIKWCVRVYRTELDAITLGVESR
ncbi:ATP-binding protein [Mesorhizobium sp. M0771]|uniref:ATP-binding protein n=1 Tax=Mesorhizobium sp. M0771 TaxID=2956997 RepID=UPI003338259B